MIRTSIIPSVGGSIAFIQQHVVSAELKHLLRQDKNCSLGGYPNSIRISNQVSFDVYKAVKFTIRKIAVSVLKARAVAESDGIGIKGPVHFPPVAIASEHQQMSRRYSTGRFGSLARMMTFNIHSAHHVCGADAPACCNIGSCRGHHEMA